ncbi:MAG: lamin tail domain-containing protein [Akkermansiaceae bacterium]
MILFLHDLSINTMARFLLQNLLPPFALSLGILNAAVEVTFTTDASATASVSDDLLETSLTSTTWPSDANINNGTTGAFNENSATNPAKSATQGAYDFNLDLTASPSGYDILEIKAYSGWADARAGQAYTIFFSEVGSATFTQITPSQVSVAADGESLVTQVRDDGGSLLGSGVDVIRFVVGVNGSTNVWREIDVIGAESGAGIESFSASPSVIAPGDPVTLSWDVGSLVTNLRIDQGVGDVTALTNGAGAGSIVLDPGPSSLTNFTLTATLPSGPVTAMLVVDTTVFPAISAFSAPSAFPSPGAPVTLNWEVSNVTSLTLNGEDVTGQTEAVVTPNGQGIYTLIATNDNGTTVEEKVIYALNAGEFLISEFEASNGGSILDEDGESSDWIEISNPSGAAGNLSGYYLTDDPSDLTKWQFPSASLNDGEMLVVFASGKNRATSGSELHTNFNLSSNGEYLALVKPDGVTIASQFTPVFPNQRPGVSYGFDFSAQGHRYFLTPTPGEENGESIRGFVADTAFSADRGFYESPVSVDITSDTMGATIRYTLDGSEPDVTSSIYGGVPLVFDETTVLRAAAFKEGFQPTNVDTQTYIFPTDVLTQPAMRDEITQNATYAPQMLDALSNIPTIALSFESPEGNNINRTELPVSVELLNFEGGSEQINAGAARYGNYVTNFEKRSIRLQFRGDYGSKRLNFPLFEGLDYSRPPTDSFDSLDIRSGNHDMVHRGAYLGNRFTDDALMDMGQVSPHGRFVHLYFNGEYRGMYHLRERWNAEMMASYLPGEAEEYDTINANNAGRQFLTGALQDGDLTEWNQLQNLLGQSDPYEKVKDLLDVENMIDFMLLFTYGTSESEFRAGGSSENGVGFKFMLKDADGFLQGTSGFLPPGGFYPADHNGPLNSMTRLRAEAHPDFMTLLADRAHQHFFNDGALTASKSSARLTRYIEEARTPYLAELARWASHSGRAMRTPSAWEAYHDYFLNTEFNELPDQRINLLRAAGMYPDITAPTYTPHGGALGQNGQLSISVPNSVPAVYQIFVPAGQDPSTVDPRLSGGAINPEAVLADLSEAGGPQTFVTSGDTWKYLDDASDQGTAWRATGYDDTAWASGPSQLGYGDSDEATRVNFVDLDPNTGGFQRNATTYFRKSDIFIEDPSAFATFTLNYTFDDGIAIYVNGVEVDRENLAANATFDTYTGDRSTDNETGTISISSANFFAGNNTIAVEIHQSSSGDSDLSFDLELIGRPPGNGNDLALSLQLTEPGWLLSRSYDPTTEEWSALNQAYFSLGTVPADASNLVVSKVHYHPAAPSTAAELAISNDQDDFEFIELMNVGTSPVSLAGVTITGGINFSFGEFNEIPAGGRMIIPRDRVAFEARYSGTFLFATDLLGGNDFENKLSNSGEQLLLTDASGAVIHDFTYNDSAPWPPMADGLGFSLVLKNPGLPIPAHDLAENWAASVTLGGAPGGDNSFGFNGDPLADADNDGLSALLEYALASSDANAADAPISSSLQTFTIAGDAADYFSVSFTKNLHAQNALTIHPQISTDLINWSTAPDLVKISEINNQDGTSTVLYRSAISRTSNPERREFVRIHVSGL